MTLRPSGRMAIYGERRRFDTVYRARKAPRVRTLDLAAARGWAAWALHIAEGWPPADAREDVLEELRHRLARLERKAGGEPVGKT